MTEAFKAALEILKLAPRYLAALGLGALFLLLAPDRALQFLGVREFAQHNRTTIGLAAVGTIGIGLIAVVDLVWTLIVARVLSKREKKRIREYLRTLTEHEAQILATYVRQKTRTQSLPFDNGVVKGLEHAGIIYRSTTIGTLSAFAYNLTPAAWECLHERDWFADQ